MTTPKYIIQKLILELELADFGESAALEHSDEFKQLFVESILPLLEDILKKYENNKSIIQINQLTISLDDLNVNPTNFHLNSTIQTISEEFEKQITRVLDELPIPSLETTAFKTSGSSSKKQLNISSHKPPFSIPENGTNDTPHVISKSLAFNRSNEKISVLSNVEQQTDILIFYLKHGYLPWNCTPENFSNPPEILKEVLVSIPDYLKQQFFTLSTSEKAIKRFVLQFSEVLVKQLLTVFSKEIISELEVLFTGLKNVSIGTTSRTAQSILYEAAMKYVLKTGNETKMRENMTQSILKEAAHITDVDLSFLEKALDTRFPLDLKYLEPIKGKQDSKKSESSEKSGEQKKTEKINKENAENLENIENSEQSEKINKENAENLENIENSENPQNLEQFEWSKEKEKIENLEHKQNRFSIEERKPNIDDDLEQLATEGVNVNNAGLILVWPYLQMFFKELNVHTENGLTEKEKAMHLLHYLCFGAEDEWECALFLNKILCGWDLETPLGRKIILSDREKEECDQLIEAIVRNWPALKNTSVEGFREAFLQRDGIISKVNDNWLLRIERKGYDIMLEQLDWGINTIQLSWNNYTIFVEW